jgi:hypothetical protein
MAYTDLVGPERTGPDLKGPAMTNLLNITEQGLNANTAVELRKAGAELGIKGASKGKKADLIAAIMVLVNEAKAAEAVKAATAPVKHATAGDDSEEAKKARRSRRGMVIVAKGTEVHKSQTFKAAAEAAGWTVTIDVTARMVEEDGEFYEIECYTATAEQKGSIVVGSWVGRAWDYDGAYAGVGGKARKVRNLKEALRILAGQA